MAEPNGSAKGDGSSSGKSSSDRRSDGTNAAKVFGKNGYAAAVAGTSRPTQPNVSLMGTVNDFLSNVTSRGPPGEKVYQERMLQFERRKEETNLRYEREMQAINEEEQNYEYEFQLSQAIQKSVNKLLNVRAQFRRSRTPADSSAEAEASANAVSGAEAEAKVSDAEAPAEASDAEASAKASGAEASAEASDSEASARLKGEGEGGSEPHEATASDNDEELHDRLLEDDVEMKGETDC
ncbi:tol-Pal system protein TolA-like [Watersipora subatra]|uniref:tol-Pal system protein TolA-like n=1 Tax=Watersipora subatra TaxID=2589382 RepID=UPI00355B3A7E